MEQFVSQILKDIHSAWLSWQDCINTLSYALHLWTRITDELGFDSAGRSEGGSGQMAGQTELCSHTAPTCGQTQCSPRFTDGRGLHF